MAQSLIKLKNVYKAYKENEIIKDLSITFDRGKSYGIMGYNGSGKSVLLKLITGYAFADTGEITIDGKILKKDMDFIMNAGVVINSPEFMNGLSAMDNLRFLAEIRNQISEKEIEEILKTMNLYEARNKKVSTFSMGMKQRLRLAQALMESPEILILDEPMNALDKEGVALVKSILKEYCDRGNTLIFTSHIKEDFIDLADVCYELEDGRLNLVIIE